MATFGIAPVDANSAAYIAWIGNKRVHPDWGASANDTADPTATYGMPYVSVSRHAAPRAGHPGGLR